MKHFTNPFLAFTIKYTGRINRIITTAAVAKAFDPAVTDPSQVQFIKTNALWDTGATGSVVTQETAQKLGLISIGSQPVNHAGGSSIVNTYMVNLLLPNNVQIVGVRATEYPLGDFGVIIGMDVLSMGDFAVTNNNNQTWVTFRYPPHKSIDFVLEANRIKYKGVRDRAPCPCGATDNTGKHIPFKQCHGKGL